MRILVYPHDLNMGGSQTNAIELAAAVTALGHECIVFGRRGSLCARIEQLGLEFIESPDPGRRPSPRLARALRDIVVEREIDVIHGYEWPPGLEAVLAAESLPAVAAVCTVMSMAVAPFLPRWLPLIVGTQQIAALEHSSGRLNVNLIEPPVDLHHNQPGTTGERAEFRRVWNLDERPLVVVVSRLVPDLKAEGIATAIAVAGDLAENTPFQLLIVGDGKARSALESAAERVNRAVGRPTVVFTGELSDPRPAYDAADVVLGMGGSALRSLAFAKPLVVQGERGFFRTLTPDTLEMFRWQGWYGVGEPGTDGRGALAAELAPLLTEPARRTQLGVFGRRVVEAFSLESAAQRQVTIYRDAWIARKEQKRRGAAAARSVAGLAAYYARQRLARLRGRQRADDFNADPVSTPHIGRPAVAADAEGPLLLFPGVGWDTLAGTDRQLVDQLSDQPIVWVDTPHSPIRRGDRVIPQISEPRPGVVRLRASSLPGVQRPFFRQLANRRRAAVARRYLRENSLTPRAIITSTTAPMLRLTRDLRGLKVYYATDDFVEAGSIWGVSKRYLAASREANLNAADLVLAVTPELGRHLQRRPDAPRWLPNGADLARFLRDDVVSAADVRLSGPIAGVVGQFNSRTDLSYLRAVHDAGISVLMVGPRWFTTTEEEQAFDDLIGLPGVQWVDGVARDRMPAYLQHVDVGLTPYADSMFNRRSYPLKTLEYLAAGIPVVATSVAPTEGLDPRYVSVARTHTEFVHAVRRALSMTWDRRDVQRSVEGHGWNSRATDLLALLNEGTDR